LCLRTVVTLNIDNTNEVCGKDSRKSMACANNSSECIQGYWSISGY